MNWIHSVSVFIVLLIYAYIDLRKKELSIRVLLIGASILGIVTILYGDVSLVYSLLGCLLGAVFIGISKWTKEALGMADAYVIMMLGVSIGIYEVALVLFYSMFLAAVVSILLLSIKKIKRKGTLPYIPFLLLSYLGVWMA